MKVILLKDVAKIGRRFDVVVVSDGFALNKLIPKNLAQSATPENLKRLQNIATKVSQDQAAQEARFKEALSALKDTRISIAVDANNEGRMFQALKAETIAAAIKEQVKHEISAEHIVMKTPIKSTGEHSIEIGSGTLHEVVDITVVSKSA